jgi:hypothetical protein
MGYPSNVTIELIGASRRRLSNRWFGECRHLRNVLAKLETVLLHMGSRMILPGTSRPSTKPGWLALAELLVEFVSGLGVRAGQKLVEHVDHLIDGVAVALPEKQANARGDVARRVRAIE